VTVDRDLFGFSAREAAELLGKGEDWLLEQARAGKIGYTLVGRDKRFLPSHIREYLRANEIRPHAPLGSRSPARTRTAAPDSPQS
jgi:hypothetical protein